MSHDRPSITAPVAIVLAGMAFLLVGYFAAYFWLCETRSCQAPPIIERNYPQPWQASFFRPAAGVEQWLRGTDVDVMCADWRP